MALSREKIEEIEGKAAEIRAEVYDGNIVLPINPVAILTKYGLTLKQGTFPNENVAGALDRLTNTIFISENDSFSRQAFTIAHEIGHFILHHNVEKDVLYRTEILMIDQQNKEEEQEANWFATALLMPKALVSAYWQSLHDVDSMAKLFGTSYSAMHWRLKNLDLIEE